MLKKNIKLSYFMMSYSAVTNTYQHCIVNILKQFMTANQSKYKVLSGISHKVIPVTLLT